MRFFNIDAHVSVIEDVSWNFRKLGHTVDSHLLSGHNWALGKPRGAAGTGDPGRMGHVGYKSMNLASWESAFHDFPETSARVRAFQADCPELAKYDGFIATYPPVFALLYDRFPGHTIVDIPIRYEHFFTNRPEAWHAFNDFLVKGIEAGRVTAVANSVYDAMYFEYFTGCQIPMVETTCSYIDDLSPKWMPTGPNSLAFGEHPGCRMLASKVPNLLFVRDVKALEQYKHADIVKARSFVWVPYTSSIMSFYEHYWLQVPMFVPSKRYLMQLADEGLALSTLSFHENPLGGSAIKPRYNGSINPTNGLIQLGGISWSVPDPHTREGRESWLDFYDFYRLPHITYFDSSEDLADKMASMSTSDLWEISRAMGRENAKRGKVVQDQWAQLLERRVPDISGGASFSTVLPASLPAPQVVNVSSKKEVVKAIKGVVMSVGGWGKPSVPSKQIARKGNDHRVVISVGIGGHYEKYLRRLRRTVKANWKGSTLFYEGVLPPGSPPHAALNYGFKVFAIREAVRLGYTSILYCDSCVIAREPLEPLFDHIEKEGYVLIRDGHEVRKWSSDALLQWGGISRKDIPEHALTAAGGFVGMNLLHEKGKAIHEAWFDAVMRGVTKVLWVNQHVANSSTRASSLHEHDDIFISSDPSVLGNLGDEAMFGVLMHKYGLEAAGPNNPWCSQHMNGVFQSTGYDDGSVYGVLE